MLRNFRYAKERKTNKVYAVEFEGQEIVKV